MEEPRTLHECLADFGITSEPTSEGRRRYLFWRGESLGLWADHLEGWRLVELLRETRAQRKAA